MTDRACRQRKKFTVAGNGAAGKRQSVHLSVESENPLRPGRRLFVVSEFYRIRSTVWKMANLNIEDTTAQYNSVHQRHSIGIIPKDF